MAKVIEYVELDIQYLLEDFSNFSCIRMGFPPEKNTTLKVLFLREPASHYVEVLVGKTYENARGQMLIINGTDDPEGLSMYKTVIKFDYHLLDSLKIDGISTIDQLMDNVPLFCLNSNLRQIFWEEFHH